MAVSEGLVKQLETTQTFFKKTLSIFAPEDEGFAPFPELYSVAGHVAHVAESIDWFLEGAFGDGWDLEFDAMITKAKAVTSLVEASEWMERAFANAIAVVSAASDQVLLESIPDTRIMGRGAAPRCGVRDPRSHCSRSRIVGSLRTTDRQRAADTLLRGRRCPTPGPQFMASWSRKHARLRRARSTRAEELTMRSRIMWCRTLRPLVPSLALMILLSARIHAQQPTDRSARPVIRGSRSGAELS